MSVRLRIPDLSLKETLECGQFFRYTKLDDRYLLSASNRILWLWQRGEFLFCEGADQDFLVHFFRLEDRFDQILKSIDRDPFIHEAIERYRGLRLLRQDPWECLVSFLCSSAKAVSHIRAVVEALCGLSGRKMTSGNVCSFSIPEPHGCWDIRRLERAGAGFRAKYLVEVSNAVDRGWLLELKRLPYNEARSRLTQLPGVGKKIADCVLLYSLDFLEAFPIDTWIAKGLRQAYFGGRSVGVKEMEAFVSTHFGPFAGYAQLYLYHFFRNVSL
jgi:N-glycosylase/DNA lyase